jgi:hypothetical protein
VTLFNGRVLRVAMHVLQPPQCSLSLRERMPFPGAKGYSHLTTARVTRETSKLRESAVHDAPIREAAGEPAVVVL